MNKMQRAPRISPGIRKPAMQLMSVDTGETVEPPPQSLMYEELVEVITRTKSAGQQLGQTAAAMLFPGERSCPIPSTHHTRRL